jgi:hypothetical protein
MLKRKAQASFLSGLMEYTDSDLEDYANDDRPQDSPDSAIENKPPARKRVATNVRVPASQPVKSKASGRRISGGSAVAGKTNSKKGNARSRAILRENANNMEGSAAEQDDTSGGEQDETGILVEEEFGSPDQHYKQSRTKQRSNVKPTKQSEDLRPTQRIAQKQSSRTRAAVEPIDEEAEEETMMPYVPTSAMKAQSMSRMTVTSSATKRQGARPRDQPAHTELQPVRSQRRHVYAEPAVEERETTPSIFEDPNTGILYSANPISNTMTRRQAPAVRRRAGSASDTERIGGDITLRRRLGEMTKKYESLDARYRDLREIGIKEAEANMDRLKQSMEHQSSGKSYEREAKICTTLLI